MIQDTQWPRYQVFIQERPDTSFRDIGSVHAPDPELALLNARDVFARRPSCFAMWVAPVEAIYTRTAQELETRQQADMELQGASEPYHIFCKTRAGGSVTWLETLQAYNPNQALQVAVTHLSMGQKASVWWVLPDRAVTRSQPEDYESLYQTAASKGFRLSTDFRTITAMRNIKAHPMDLSQSPPDSERHPPSK